LVDIASAEKDKASQDFLWGFVREQVEEEESAQKIVDRFKLLGEKNIAFLDAELAKR
jgi:ferritin